MPHHHSNMTLIGAPTLHNHTLSIQVNDNQDSNISGQFLNHTRTFAIDLDRFTDEENLNPIGVDTPFKREMAMVMFVCFSLAIVGAILFSSRRKPKRKGDDEEREGEREEEWCETIELGCPS
ncbi:hypothetical protein B0J14DRAFT_706461 [Halenospora varia]|nr:hypothetical protein B0J14DRAFT_706461 [Halenospora varia]